MKHGRKWTSNAQQKELPLFGLAPSSAEQISVAICYQLLHTVNCGEGIGLPHCVATKKRATITIV